MTRFAVATAALLIAAATMTLFLMRRHGLPYHDRFSEESAEEWKAMGGLWFLKGDKVVNQSDEWGAKLVAGSPDWKDYSLDADVQMVGHGGGVGLLGRVSDTEPGTDAYSGYLVGLRSNDEAVVLGRADHGWIEARPVPMPGGVPVDTWFHVHSVFVGCTIAAQVTNLATGQQAWTAASEPSCPRSGMIGLRSSGTGGVWRNIQSKRANQSDLAPVLMHTTGIKPFSYPLREDDNYRMRREVMQSRPIVPAVAPAPALTPGTPRELTSIGSLHRTQTSAELVRIRGTVTLTSPLFIQDESGGIELRPQPKHFLNLGDEVEATGTAETGAADVFLHVTNLRLRRERTLTIPVSGTPTQASEGTLNGRLIDVHGRLLSKSSSGTLAELRLSDPEQTFNAELPLGLSRNAYDRLQVGSELRLRGVCVPQVTSRSSGAFWLLLRSQDDVAVLTLPPWWSPRYLVRYALLFLVLLALTASFYVHYTRQRLRAALDERQRLANQLHDSLAQNLAGVGFHLQGIRHTLEGGAVDRTALAERVDVAFNLVARSHREASAEIAALHLDTTSGEDLLTALERSARAMLGGQEPPLRLVRQGQFMPLPLRVQDALFQVGREAIGNALRHADADIIEVVLTYDQRSVTLCVTDNGAGFEPDETTDGLGLAAMRERMLRIAGVLKVRTKIGGGTGVLAQVPLRRRISLQATFEVVFEKLMSRTPRRSIGTTPDRP